MASTWNRDKKSNWKNEERMDAFSDAVIAGIIITMVLERRYRNTMR